jgi:hypothetical protein
VSNVYGWFERLVHPREYPTMNGANTQLPGAQVTCSMGRTGM